MRMESTNNLVTSSVNNLSILREEKAKKTFGNMTMKERFDFIKSVITVEPLLAFYFIPSLICGPALYTLQLEKSCRVNAGYNKTVCDAILSGEHQNYTSANDEVQEILTKMQAWQTPLQNFVPIILILFLASYSDRHKIRKPFLLLPIVGEFFAIAGCILCVVFMDQLPVEFLGFCQTVVPSFLGGSATLIMAVFAYISDISTIEMRTLRIGVVQITLTVCILLYAVGGILFELIGYYGVFAIGGVSYAIALIYGIVYVKEKLTKVKYERARDCFNDVFNPKHAIDTLCLLIKPKKVNVPQLILVMIVFFISALVANGETILFWLFMQNVYSYTPVMYSYYETAKNAINIVGALIFLPLFTKVFKLHDAVIIIVTFIDKIVSNLLLFFLLNKYGLIAGTFVANCASIGNTALRSLATKSVKVNDLAKALSLLSLVETLGSMASAPLYSGIVYANTLSDFPEAFLLVCVGLFSACVVVIFFLYFCYSKMFKWNLLEDKPAEKKAPERFQEITKL